jgi:hypothetical protein
MKTWFPSVLFIFVVGTIGLFVWPTKYRHFDYSGVPMRENRFTGKIDVLKQSHDLVTWEDISTPTERARWYTVEQEKQALEKIKVRGGFKNKGDDNVSYYMRTKELEDEITKDDPRYKQMLRESGLDENVHPEPRK